MSGSFDRPVVEAEEVLLKALRESSDLDLKAGAMVRVQSRLGDRIAKLCNGKTGVIVDRYVRTDGLVMWDVRVRLTSRPPRWARANFCGTHWEAVFRFWPESLRLGNPSITVTKEAP